MVLNVDRWSRREARDESATDFDNNVMATNRKGAEKAAAKRRKGEHAPAFRTRAERLIAGEALRDSVPRKSHGDWKSPCHRPDPIQILQRSNRGRLAELVPIRYGRMVSSPFTFLRGSAAIMAYDLAATPTTGVRVQACGDCHLLNFGLCPLPPERRGGARAALLAER